MSRLKKLIKRFLSAYGYRLVRDEYPGDFRQEEIEIIEAAKPFSLLGVERLHALISSVKHVVRHEIPGALVVCGVWKGGSALAMIKALQFLDETDRQIYLYDTFAGMPEPGSFDYHKDFIATEEFAKHKTSSTSSTWNNASLSEVKKLLLATGYDEDLIFFVKGKVEVTIPENAPEEISIMHLDTDWYSSTAHELHHLFPRLGTGGILIVDDYGHWAGQRRALDEYLEETKLQVFLHRVDYTARIIVKT